MRGREELLGKIRNALEGVDVGGLVEEVLQAGNVFIIGFGRSKLVGSAFVMRLVQMGFPAYTFDSPEAPAISKGDLAIAISGSGTTEFTVYSARMAKERGARLLAITVNPGSRLAGLADRTITLRAKSKFEEGDFPMGTVFEDSTLILFELAVEGIRKKKKIGEADMFDRHNSFG